MNVKKRGIKYLKGRRVKGRSHVPLDLVTDCILLLNDSLDFLDCHTERPVLHLNYDVKTLTYKLTGTSPINC